MVSPVLDKMQSPSYDDDHHYLSIMSFVVLRLWIDVISNVKCLLLTTSKSPSFATNVSLSNNY